MRVQTPLDWSSASTTHPWAGTDVGATVYATRPAPATLDLARLPRVVFGDGGEFEIVGELGSGGMAEVVRARERALRRDVAVKYLRNERDALERTRFLREAWITAQLAHPSIPAVHRVGVDERGRVVLVMKRLVGRSMTAALDRRTVTDVIDMVGLDGWLDVLVEVAQAMAYAHATGFLHRDLKPGNIMLGDYGETWVLDWGLARGVDDPDDDNELVGTPAYLPPEMALGDVRAQGPQTDVYLLGGILCEILNGVPPHSGASAMDAVLASAEGRHAPMGSHVPPELARICERCLAREPSHRFRSASELIDAIRGFRMHRQSHTLVAAGEAALSLQIASRSLADAQKHHGVARAALIEAIASWPDNTSARFALDRAEADLEQRHRHLDRELAALRTAASEQSLDVARRDRGRFLAACGVVFGAADLVAFWLEASGRAPLTYSSRYLFQAIAFPVFLLMAGTWRHRLGLNATNRRFVGAGVIALLMLPVLGVVCDVLGVPLHSSMVLEMVSVTLVVAMAGVALDPRMLVTLAPYGALLAAACADPRRVLLYEGLGLLVLLPPMAAITSRRSRHVAAPAPARDRQHHQ